MTQVHVIIGKHRTDHCSMQSAIDSIRRRVILRRIDLLIEAELVAFLRILFCVD